MPRCRTARADRGLILAIAITICAMIILMKCTGCAMTAKDWAGSADPTTSLIINPLTGKIAYENEKDVNVKVEDLDADLQAKKLKAKLIDIRSNASDVREANVEQIYANAKAQQVQVELEEQRGKNIEKLVGSVSELARTVIPGGIAGVSNGGAAGILQGATDKFWYFVVILGVLVFLVITFLKPRTATAGPVVQYIPMPGDYGRASTPREPAGETTANT